MQPTLTCFHQAGLGAFLIEHGTHPGARITPPDR